MSTTTGHRERKKQQTREAIAQAGLRLFVERGYDATTLAEIAEAAGVSTRTIFSYFPGKEDILFSGFDQIRNALAQAFAERPSGGDALQTLRDFILAGASAKSELDHELGRICGADETLQTHKRARLLELQELIAAAIADDLGSDPDDLRPQVAAASVTAAFEVLERQERKTHVAPTAADVTAAIDPIIAFVRAGLQSLPTA